MSLANFRLPKLRDKQELLSGATNEQLKKLTKELRKDVKDTGVKDTKKNVKK